MKIFGMGKDPMSQWANYMDLGNFWRWQRISIIYKNYYKMTKKGKFKGCKKVNHRRITPHPKM